MIDHNIQLIHAYCTKFRRAIEKSDKTKLPISFRDFPRGSCGDTTPLLGAYLSDHKFGSFQYVCGEKHDGERWFSHAWLLNDNGLIIDITADQFPEITSKVIVTYQSKWHYSFDWEIKHIAHFNIYGPETVRNLESAYLEICKSIGVEQ